MNNVTDRPTPIERHGAPDCLVEMALAWLQRPLHGLTDGARALAIDEICLLIAQMRHRESRLIEIEQHRWIERVTIRLCQQCGSMSGYEGAVQLELGRRVVVNLLRYHEWREQVAPMAPMAQRPLLTGPSDGGEIHA